jgi:hypothetical protein
LQAVVSTSGPSVVDELRVRVYRTLCTQLIVEIDGGVASVEEILNVSIVLAGLSRLGNRSTLAIDDYVVLYKSVVIDYSTGRIPGTNGYRAEIIYKRIPNDRHVSGGVPTLDAISCVNHYIVSYH